MSLPWSDDPNRERAEELIAHYADQWPTPCTNLACQQRHPRKFYKNSVNTKTGKTRTRNFRCVCTKETLSTATVVAILGAVVTNLGSSSRQPAASRQPVLQRTLRLEDLDPLSNGNSDDGLILETQPSAYHPSHSPALSSVHFGPSQRPAHYLSQQLLNQHQHQTPSFPTMPSNASFNFPNPTPDFPTMPSDVSYHSSAYATPPAPVYQQPESSNAAGKRRAMMTSTWQEGPVRDTGSPSLELAEALQEKERLLAENHQQSQQLMHQAHQMRNLQLENAQLHSALTETQARLAANESRLNDTNTTLHTTNTVVAQLQAAVADLRARPPTAHVAAQVDAPAAAEVDAPAPAPARPRDAPNSYAAAALDGLSAEQRAVIQDMKPPRRPFQARNREPRVTTADTATCLVYFGGLQSCPLGTLKTRLRALRVRTSAIPNISFVGRTICEMLVESSYKDALIAKMETCTFRHLPNYDPAVPQVATVSEEVRLRLRDAYATRLRNTAATTIRPVVREVFLQRMVDAQIAIPEDLADNTAMAVEVAPVAAEPGTDAVPTTTDEHMEMDEATGDTATAEVATTVSDSNPPAPGNVPNE